MPVNYPPAKAGEALAGMGTPDLRGTRAPSLITPTIWM
jgi:hypothetical protein